MGIGRWWSQRTCLRSLKKRRAPPRPRQIERCWGPLFSKAKSTEFASQKSRRVAGSLPRSGRASSFRGNASAGTKVKETAHHHPFTCRFDNPTTAVQENGAYGGQGKAVGSQKADGFAVSELRPFCAGHHFAKNRSAVRSACV